MLKKETQVNEDRQWDLVIEPCGKLLDLKLKEIWHYRDLLMLLVRRDFVSFYKQTILGPIWFFIQPLFTTIIYTFVFSSLAGIKTDGVPPPLFYMTGITAWNYFSDCLTKTSTVFRDNASVFGKVYFPRLIMPISIVVSNLVKFGIQFLLLLMMIIFYQFKGFSINWNIYILLFPLLILLMALLGLGTGLIVSALTTKYRDMIFLLNFGVQLMMYATAVVYPLSEAIKKYPSYQQIFSLNPMTTIIETFRLGFIGIGQFSWGTFIQSSLFCVFITFIGLVVFNKVEKNFVDTV